MIVDLDDPKKGDVGFAFRVFPDGQPHYEFSVAEVVAAAEHGAIDVIGRIKSGNDLLNIALALDAIKAIVGDAPEKLNLNIAYLLGARMDRRIAPGQPATLHIIAGLVNEIAQGVGHLRILDPHSAVTMQLIPKAEVIHPDRLVAAALSEVEAKFNEKAVVVIPDAGAIPRTNGILKRLNLKHFNANTDVARCSKVRNSQTGKLSGFAFDEGNVRGRIAMIVDDICDGGGTFSGVAKVLREQGATKVFLCVTHGIFSKGVDIAGVDHLFSTDSFQSFDAAISRDKLTVMEDFVAGELR
jgi:ribose-phosphate pyrophosphokinase